MAVLHHQFFVLSLTLLFLYPPSTTTAQPVPAASFKCMTNNATCQALVGYVTMNTTTLAFIQSLFQVKFLSSILKANKLPPSTPQNYTVSAQQTVRIPFPCRCTNGTGLSDRVPQYTVVEDDTLYHIAGKRGSVVFSGLVTDQQIQDANNITGPYMIVVGLKLWIPLPCSCDDVEGQKVIHYGHVVAAGSTMDEIAAEFGITIDTLLSVNANADPSMLIAGQVLDVPLKGQVLDQLATPSKADEAIMKKLVSALSPISGWSGSDFCIWFGVVCDSNGFVTSISLPSQNLSGSIPSDLNSLTQLTTISLQNNSLSGAIPSFANLKLLQEIHLDSNNFISVPNGAFSGLSRLQNLSLENLPNISPWALPTGLSNSTLLVSFYASNANIIGPIPDIFGPLTSLQNLRLSYNNLTGSLPNSLRRTQMDYLWLDNQHMGLSGTLQVLEGMNFLKQVWLHSNKLTGPIPDLSNCTGLFDLQLQSNLLTGVVPASLMSLPRLVNISLQSNKLQGPLPVFPESVTVTLEPTNMFCKDVSGDCDPQVTTLLEVAGSLGYPLKLAEAWPGNDACNQWEFVICDDSGHIILLNLSKHGFSGTISPALGNLTNLRELYLNNNNLIGTIPVSLTTLPKLRKVDISNNDLEGQVPKFQSSVTVFTAGNKNIGLRNSTSGTHERTTVHKRPFGKKTIILLAVLAPIISIIVLLILANVYKKRKCHEGSQEDTEQWGSFLQLETDSPVRFTYQVLKTATNNFDMQKKLGGGGFGSVFEGSLSDGTKIAVKRLDNIGQGKKEFMAEVQTIGSIHHVNLVKLVGFCAEITHRLLVYEHLSNGSLDKWIFDTDSKVALLWGTRKKIILHIAKGLAYLHEECQRRIAHLDIKPQNVLLDDEFNARLSDFGLAKLIDRDQSYVMTQMRGTRGYLAPEWLGRKITEKADIYSYGIVVLEVVFGRKNLDLSQPEESNIIHLVKKAAEVNQLSNLLDQCSEDMKQNSEDIKKTIELAIQCLHTEPVRRPSMSTVVKVLEGAIILEAVHDYSLTALTAVGNPVDTTHVSVSVLSGPR